MFAADAVTFLADFGSPATWSPSTGGPAVSGIVIFDQPSEVIEGSSTISRSYLVRMETATWTGLKRGEVMVIDGEGGSGSYRLRTDLRAEDDGVFSIVDVTRI